MKVHSLNRLLAILLLAAAVTFSTSAFAQRAAPRPLQQSGLPNITFLGEGPGTFTAAPPMKLLVKTYSGGNFYFTIHDELTYTAKKGERVWSTDFVPDEPIRLFHQWKDYGTVSAGCVVNYVQIEDNVDDRRNTFYINGEVLQVVEQGWVTYGSFTVPEDGDLTFYAEDSIGMIVEYCADQSTAVPSASPTVTGLPVTDTPTAVPTATAEDTATAMPSATATLPATAVVVEPSETPTSVPTATNVPDVTEVVPTAAPTNTPEPLLATATATAGVPVTGPTIVPSATPLTSIILITATPLSTPAAIPITGGGPGPGETAAVSAVLVGLSGLVGAGWWLLGRAYKRGR